MMDEASERTYTDEKTKKVMAYSNQLVRIVQRLCDPEHRSRLNIIEVYRWLLSFQKQILGFQQFRMKIVENSGKSQYSIGPLEPGCFSIPSLESGPRLKKKKISTVQDLLSQNKLPNSVHIRVEDFQTSSPILKGANQ